MCSRNSLVLQNHAELLLPFVFLGAAKLVVAVAVFLLTFYVISQVFEIKMDASLGNLFGKFHPRPFTSPPLLLPLAPHVPSSFTSLCFSTHSVQASSLGPEFRVVYWSMGTYTTEENGSPFYCSS